MRLWHYALLSYLPEYQFRGQFRELVAIMRDWRDKGTTNHILINRVMDFPKSELYVYFQIYADLYNTRYYKRLSQKYYDEFQEFSKDSVLQNGTIFSTWHNNEYLRTCMANLFEKHFLARGKSRISDNEWNVLYKGYAIITGQKYEL